ncbi:MAG: triose-phosphate isomerase [Candidatus Wallbacteria bacterium HGW-Wallbacteria-1]|uniref:Triosephosphate isomerase n=1 Tax=Candidatus Wallbacteria bacterium HGW-Wallbacteria-1 TaxID=2013854 RepID=A0A2N1PJW7_9BACT|nr:MAG: triose-phosphate isomerase [Candidatus Wallbacteria bacterium HGW-Wallbacteria-1]
MQAARENRKILIQDDVRFTALALEVGTRDNVLITRATASPRPFVVAGNWKMNSDLAQTIELMTALGKGLSQSAVQACGAGRGHVVVAPPFTSLAIASRLVEGLPIQLGAQNLNHHDSGAHTGEVSASMLLSCGAGWVIIGHSERRAMGEDDALIAAKVAAAQAAGLKPILCVGESLIERENQRTFSVIRKQIAEGLAKATLQGLCIAYEPIWAIGTGVASRPDDASAVHSFIRDHIIRIYGESGGLVPILYGGSVTDENCSTYFAEADIDGALVGGASLRAGKFLTIIDQCVKARCGD